MSKHITSILLVASITAVSACSLSTTRVANDANTEEEFVIIEPAPISEEPVFTGKYK